jgi:pyruvate-ferredoxin/flavodoxin oxidoreductase
MVNEVIAIYPITPSSPMGEFSDQWSAEGRINIWGEVPTVVELQSEGGASGALHGSLQTGALTTTFTASQGLLLMIPNMYKIAGELTPAVIHVSARSLACQALSIFGDHSDVMATRATGFALLASNNIQEIMDFALIAQAASLESRVPFLHFFDGFRSSHEVLKVEELTHDDARAMIDEELVRAHRRRALSPDNPFIRGTAQNPDVYFQGRETVNPYYTQCPQIVQNMMDKFAGIAGRQYHLFDYVGAPDADRVIVIMGSGAEAVHEAVEYLNEHGEKVGVLKVRLFHPFSVEHFFQALPPTTRKIAVLDRTKEPGALGEPLYQDVITAFSEHLTSGSGTFAVMPVIVGGRYGLSSKEFTPAMVKGIYDELAQDAPKNHFTIGIIDDVTHTSLEYNPDFSTEAPSTVRAMFYGLGSDGTVGANKNSIKIIGDDTDNNAQGYFVYDSKKAGSVTVSHLRFGPKPIHSTYLITKANFIACHQFSFLERFDILKTAVTGSTFLLNSQYGPEEVWDHLPRTAQQHLIDKKLKFYLIDGYAVAKDTGMGARINTIMQTCFFAISGLLPRDEAIASIKRAIKKTYGARGEAVVEKNYAAVDATLAKLHEVKIPGRVTSTFDIRPAVPAEAPAFVQNVTAKIIAGLGDDLPVGAMPVDGTYPSGTTRWEKRNIALEIPVWDAELCSQCGKCVLVCPHATIRAKVCDPELLAGAPPTFKSVESRFKEFKGQHFILQVAAEDCTGCEMCVHECPIKSKSDASHKAINMMSQAELRDTEAANWKFFLTLPETDRRVLSPDKVRDIQLFQPLFEFSGACAGCGETPYVKLLSQLFGDRALITNATGCSSIYGGNLPTTPWTINAEGRGPAWTNSLFEDNAEFGVGMRLAVDQQAGYARLLLKRLAPKLGDQLVQGLLNADQSNDAGIAAQRERVQALKDALHRPQTFDERDLLALADILVKKSVWIMGGDGWAYDIGYGGLDHVLSMGRNVNLLVLDTEVYSNTGGQMSKSTPRGAVAKFAFGGKPGAKKDLAMMAMTYGNVYIARVAMGANDRQCLKAFLEAEAYDGPSLIIAYSHCIAHGYNLVYGMDQQKAAVQSGHWPLMRFDPRLAAEGKNPLQLDSKAPSIPIEKYMYNETRFAMLTHTRPEDAKRLLQGAANDAQARWRLYKHWADMKFDGEAKEENNG